jgi:hypothetical protein
MAGRLTHLGCERVAGDAGCGDDWPVRREHRIKGKSIKEIVRELNVSRNTVQKVLRSGVTSFEYARAVEPRAKLGAWRDDLDRLLLARAG